MISMGLSIFHFKSANFAILAQKVRKVRFCALLRPKTHFFALFAPKRSKRAWARNVALDNAFLGILEAIFAKRRKMTDFQRFSRFFAFWAQNQFLASKSGPKR